VVPHSKVWPPVARFPNEVHHADILTKIYARERARERERVSE